MGECGGCGGTAAAHVVAMAVEVGVLQVEEAADALWGRAGGVAGEEMPVMGGAAEEVVELAVAAAGGLPSPEGIQGGGGKA